VSDPGREELERRGREERERAEGEPRGSKAAVISQPRITLKLNRDLDL
jgi:hypothetical protein